MIFVDASAIVAIITREPGADDLQRRLEAHAERLTSPIAVYEATLAVARKQSIPLAQAQGFIERLLRAEGVAQAPVGEPVGRGALAAFERFGKGRHPARLNMGDCFAYAGAKHLGARLLFKGDDFPRTDIEAA